MCNKNSPSPACRQAGIKKRGLVLTNYKKYAKIKV
jgi:hypothetical protein